MSIVKLQYVIPVHLRIVRCHQTKKRHCIWLMLVKVFAELKKVLSLKWRNPPWEAFNWWRGWKAENWATELILRLQGLWQYLCTKAVCHRDSPLLGAVWALIEATGKTLNPLSYVSRVSLYRCFLIMSLAFSIFSEDWGLQEQCKWYCIPRVFNTPWVTAALKVETLSLWTLEFKIPLISWEVSTVKFCQLVNLWALGISKTIVEITLKQCGYSLFSATNKVYSDPVGKVKAETCKRPV